LKVLRNAEANAKAKGLVPKDLFLSHVQVNKAPTVRRRTFRAHGRIGPYVAHPSHIEVVLSEKPKVTKNPEKKAETKVEVPKVEVPKAEPKVELTKKLKFQKLKFQKLKSNQ